jgi:3-hydroxyisobutyrate dehydrogenase-like beta-hydroxyacid dehydrogenase
MTAAAQAVTSVSFVGTGNMGSAMARSLLGGGFAVRAYDLVPSKTAALVPDGAIAADSLTGSLDPGGVVISMVTDDAALREISLSPGGVLDTIGAGGAHVSMSTISPGLSDELVGLYSERGAAYLAAPVLGRPDVAAAGKLSILVAGEAAAKQRVRPALEAIGARIHDFGERPAAANAAKVAINFLILAGIEALAEAGGLADRAGVDRAELTRAAVESGLFGGAVYNGYGSMIAEHRYTPALFRVALGIKDATLAERLASSVGAELPIASLAREHLESAEAAGWGDEDWAVIGRLLASNGHDR